MAKKDTSVLAIDIGGVSLKMAEFSFPAGGGVVLEKFAFRDFGDRDVDPGTAFAEAYHQLLAEHNFTARRVCLSISGQTSFSRLSKLPPLSGNSSSIARIVAFEAKQVVPYSLDEVEWGYQLVSHMERTERVIEAATPEEEPIVDVEENEEFEALFIAVKREHLTVFTDTILDSGKEILSVDIAPVAMFNAAKATQCAGEDSVLLLNIGGRCTSLVIADGGRIFVRSIPIAGDAITQQISKEFGISFADAEDLKRRHGFVALGGAYEEPESEVAATISKIARNVMTRLHGEITRSINVWRSQHHGNAPARLLLAGGGSLMFYTQEFFKEKLNLPVDYLNVFSAVTIGSEINRQQLLDVAPMFPELVGMSLRSVTSCPVDISLVPESIRFQKAFQRKKLYFYLSAASIVLCLLIFLVAVGHRTDYSKTLVSETKGKVESTQKMQQRIAGLTGEYQGAKGEYEEALGFLQQRGTWTGMLNELESIVPDLMWLVALEGQGTDITPVASAAADPAADEMGGGLFDDPAMMAADPEAMAAQNAGNDAMAAIAAQRNYVRKVAANVGEVKELRVRFYTLILDNDLVDEEFRKALKNTKYFSDADDAFVIEAYEGGKGEDNLKAFTALIKLKEPIKK